MDTPQKHGMYHGPMMINYLVFAYWVCWYSKPGFMVMWQKSTEDHQKKFLHVLDEFHRVAGFMIVYEQTCTRLLFLLPARKWWHMVTKPSKMVPQRWALIYQRCQRFPPLKRLPDLQVPTSYPGAAANATEHKPWLWRCWSRHPQELIIYGPVFRLYLQFLKQGAIL